MYPKQILEVLQKIHYPADKQNIVEAGMVEDDIRVEGKKISFSLIAKKRNDPFIKSIVKACETAILQYISPDAEIKGNIYVKYKPAEVERQKPLSHIKNIIAVSSGKGGVGKSTVSANLAVALSKLGCKVGLLDADIFGPSIPKMFNIEDYRPEAHIVGDKYLIVPAEKYGVKILSIGFFVERENAVIWRGAMASNAVKQLLNEADWGNLDYFIVDLPPGTSDIHLTMVQNIDFTGAIIVSTPQKVALSDAIKGIQMFENEKINVPILGLVENMAYFTPAELPQNRYYIFGRGGCRKLAEERNLPFLAQIPLVQSLCESGDNGVPITLNDNTVLSGIFIDLAKKLYLLR
ncbi:MAG: Mrp/NBP35 family ATP-binding protein [Prevotellaceae bacterium]|jgi:ATP-binding protein involved in chromosome partitioning|nr:Mrp/NBP35 family ATP-binding protein [Prevotellaceae bacterium]